MILVYNNELEFNYKKNKFKNVAKLEIKKNHTHCLTIQGSKIKILKNWITMKTLPIETCMMQQK